MKKLGISLLIISIPMFLLGVCGFTYRFSSTFISELAKYCFISWWLVALTGFSLHKIGKDIEAKRRQN